MRVLTYQSKEVVDYILNGEDYKADLNLARVKLPCDEDITQLGGDNPIWGYVHPDWLQGEEIDFEYVQHGEMFLNHRQEMSLSASLNFEGFYLIEMDLDPEHLKISKTFNNLSNVIVFNEIKASTVTAIYQVVQESNNSYVYSWYLPKIIVVRIFRGNPLVEDDFQTVERPIGKDSFPHNI